MQELLSTNAFTMVKWRAPMKYLIFLFWGEERLRGNYDDGSARASTWTRRLTKLVSSIFNIRQKNYDGEFYSFDPRWIYLVAALCGILLLLTIVLILAKVDHRHQKTKLILECYSWASSRENGQRRRMMLTLWCRQTLRKCDWATICDQSEARRSTVDTSPVEKRTGDQTLMEVFKLDQLVNRPKIGHWW